MSAAETIDPTTATRALAEAAQASLTAPSFHNTQPWRWRIHDGQAELRAETSRQLPASDPQGRMLTVSCGAVLHHACVALAAEGFHAAVARCPDPNDPDLLARLAIDGRIPVTPAAVRLMQTTYIRHTDRRPLLDQTVPAAVVAGLANVAAGFRVDLSVLGWDQVIQLAAVTDRSQRLDVSEAATRAELESWIGPSHPPGAGIPDDLVPERAPRTTVPGRDFGHTGSLPISDGHDRSAVFAVLSTPDEGVEAWLRTGEALSAIWLDATEHNISVLPLSAPVEDAAGAYRLRGVTGGSGYPMIVVRLGYADPEHGLPDRTPRLTPSQTIEVVEE